MYLNTQSGLAGALDTIGQLVAANQQNDAQMRGLSAAGIAGLTPADAPKGMLSGILGSLGIGGGGAAQPGAQAAAPASAPQQAALPSPAALPAAPPSIAVAPPSANKQSFIQAIAPHALSVAQQTGIDPRIVIAQSALETGFGQHAPGNNFFGIKGQGQNLATNEVVDGKNTPTMASFAAYPDMASSAQAYADFINKNPRYAELKSAEGLGPQIAALGRSGYATDPNYATKVGLLAGSIPQAALGFAPQGSGASAAPAAQAIASATGGGSAPPSADSTSGANAAAPTIDQIRTLIQNPATRSLGLQLWQQAISPKDGYTLKQGESRFDARNNLVAGIPAAPIAAKANETLVDPITHQPIFTAPGKDLDLKQIGEDQYGNKQFGILDKMTGQVTPVAAPAGASGAPTDDPNLHGKDFLSKLNPQIAAQVQAYAEGRVKLPTGQGANTPFARQMRAAVLQYDPEFDATNTDARFKTRLDFSPGGGPNSAGVAITAGNTAIQHLGELSDAAEELHNSRVPFVNTITQGIGSATGGNLPGTKFQTALQNYTDEITKFYRGTGGTESEIQARMKSLSPTMSPDQLKTAIATEVDLLNGKINALQARWHQGMGTSVPDFPIVQPKSQAALDRIASRVAGAAAGGTPAPVSPAAPAVPAPTAPAAGRLTPEQAQALPPGTPFIGMDGQPRVRH